MSSQAPREQLQIVQLPEPPVVEDRLRESSAELFEQATTFIGFPRRGVCALPCPVSRLPTTSPDTVGVPVWRQVAKYPSGSGFVVSALVAGGVLPGVWRQVAKYPLTTPGLVFPASLLLLQWMEGRACRSG